MDRLFENNKIWAERMRQEQPDFFERLCNQQSPEFLWIGCSDSRVPANEIVNMMPGELFVHRNVANLVLPGDLNCMSVLQYAVEVLKVKHILVCGHYGCGGVQAAMSNLSHGMIDGWLHNIKNVYHKHRQTLDLASSEEERLNRLCEVNVIEQVANLSQTPVVQKAWGRGDPLTIHGVIYSIKDGILKDLNVRVMGVQQTPASFHIKDSQTPG
ncbi:MAG: carbonate dehydratase [Gammaproteobacteria bacterium]|nr:carbonate dehydratase [Gammaproteobacteria bacterium]